MEDRMRLIHPLRRCSRCRYPVQGDGYRDDGKLFCSKSCAQIYALDQINSGQAKFRSPWYIVVGILAMLMSMAVTDQAYPHDPYSQWLQPNSTLSCCNGKKVNDQGIETGDCEKVASRFDGKAWWAKHGGYWIKIPDDKIIRERNPTPEVGHLCINASGVLCYVPPATGT
jgi:hypothetical protein